MKRTITGFHQDEEDHWVAELDCGHGQHMRHTPPFYERPWVLTVEGRASRLGTEVECLKCDQFEWPDGLSQFRQTPEFSEETIPAGLLKDHATGEGVWGKIEIQEGELLYKPEIGEPIMLEPARDGVVVPEMKHAVEPVGSVRFLVRFYRLSINREDQSEG